MTERRESINKRLLEIEKLENTTDLLSKRNSLLEEKNELLKEIDELEAYSNTLAQIVKEKGINAEVEGETLKSRVESVSITKADQSIDVPNRVDNPFEPNDEELALINTKTLEDLTKDKVKSIVIRAAAVNSPTDDDIIEESALNELGIQAKDVGLPILLASHSDQRDHTAKAINTKGIVYDYFMKEGALYYKAYFPLSTNNRPIVEDILNGLYSKGSVGFYMSPMDYHCSGCNIPMVSKDCPHQPGEELPGGNRIKGVIKRIERNAELSLVAVPARTEARAIKTKSEEDSDISKIELDLTSNDSFLKALLEEIASLKQQILKISSSTDRIINDDTISGNTMTEENVSKEESTMVDVPSAPADIQPDVESHQVIEPPHHQDAPDLTKAIEKLDGLDALVKSIQDNQLAILGFVKDTARLDNINSKLDLILNQVSVDKSVDEKLKPVVNKDLNPNQALIERLHIIQ